MLTENQAKLSSLSASNQDPLNSYKWSLKIVGVVAALDKDKNNNSISYINQTSQIADAKIQPLQQCQSVLPYGPTSKRK